MKAQFGMIGLGTMGRNFLLNVAEKGFPGVGYDLDAKKRELLIAEGSEYSLKAPDNVRSFVAELELPRRVMLLVPAGPIVDNVIHDILPFLEQGDIIIDGGNSHFLDTERRELDLKRKGIEFIGVGISGGEEGARHGASIMAGGDQIVYEHVRPFFEAASAKVNGEPCAAHVGKGSAGHFVKMVHNGIEYGLMQLIAETYDLMTRGFEMTAGAIAELFAEWDRGELNSFLIEISATVLKKRDTKTGSPLVDVILDTAGQKGTGKWTSQVAMDLGIPVPTIDSAVTMRQISAHKTERIAASEELRIAVPLTMDEQLRESALESVRDGLYLAFILTYAQGMSLLKAASVEKGYELDMVEIARIWRGGCIIRAALLEKIREAFSGEPTLENLILADTFIPVIRRNHAQLKAAFVYAMSCDVPCLALSASYNYMRSLSAKRLPANLIQAQRDYFGAHTYQRLDETGTFHTPDWDEA